MFSDLNKMSSVLKYSRLGLCGLLAGIALSSCEGRHSEVRPASNPNAEGWDRHQAEMEYRLTQTELTLAKLDRPYMVLDFASNQVELKLKGTIVWNCLMEITQFDSQELKEFPARFMGNEERVMLPLVDKYLFAGEEKTPDSVLAIVGSVTNVDPELLQRDVPARFQLFWDYGLTIEVRTKIAGKPRSVVKSALVELRHTLRSPFGEAYFVLNMNPDDALTLYRAAHQGMPTLLYPPE